MRSVQFPVSVLKYSKSRQNSLNSLQDHLSQTSGLRLLYSSTTKTLIVKEVTNESLSKMQGDNSRSARTPVRIAALLEPFDLTLFQARGPIQLFPITPKQ